MGKPLVLFLCGDVMPGRGIDQALLYPSNPVIYEPFMQTAEGYLALAEQAHGPIPKPASFSYIWGDLIGEMARADLRIINLETAVTSSGDYWKGKGINYRMSPENAGCLTSVHIDFCSLANNHTLDWGITGLEETLRTLAKAGIKCAGAGMDMEEAKHPAIITAGQTRVIVYGCGSNTSGIPESWAARKDQPGINLLPDFSAETARAIGVEVSRQKEKGGIAIASIHWGGNWGYEIPLEQIEFAHSLIDQAGIDIIHGHSSHHVKGIEVYKGKLVLYGCGDFINDYEGIGGYEEFAPGIGLAYFASIDSEMGNLLKLEMIPTRVRRFRVERAPAEDAARLKKILDREGQAFGTSAEIDDQGRLYLKW